MSNSFKSREKILRSSFPSSKKSQKVKNSLRLSGIILFQGSIPVAASVIYEVFDDVLVLVLSRTGSHSELFR